MTMPPDTDLPDTDLIDRLRRTYEAAASIDVVPPPLSTVTSARPAPVGADGTRRFAPLLIAASFVLVLAGLVAVVWVRPTDGVSANSLEQLTSRVRHSTLSVIPDGFGLVGIDSTVDADTLTFSDGTRELSITTQRVEPGESTMTIGADSADSAVVRASTAEVTGSRDAGYVVRWREQPGVVVEVAATGTWSLPTVLAVAEGIVMVSDEAWSELNAAAGFAQVYGADRAVVDDGSVRIRDRGRMNRSVTGSLQTGVQVELWDGYGFGPSPSRSVNRFVADAYIVTGVVGDELIRISGASGELSVPLQADPGVPQVRYASFSVEMFGPDEALTFEFLDATGTVVERREVER